MQLTKVTGGGVTDNTGEDPVVVTGAAVEGASVLLFELLVDLADFGAVVMGASVGVLTGAAVTGASVLLFELLVDLVDLVPVSVAVAHVTRRMAVDIFMVV